MDLSKITNGLIKSVTIMVSHPELHSGDVISYQGFPKSDFPRFPKDSKYAVIYGTEFICEGICVGHYKDDKFIETSNPLDGIFYKIKGEVIDNESFIPNIERKLPLPGEFPLEPAVEQEVVFDIAAFRNFIFEQGETNNTYVDKQGRYQRVKGEFYISADMVKKGIKRSYFWTITSGNRDIFQGHRLAAFKDAA